MSGRIAVEPHEVARHADVATRRLLRRERSASWLLAGATFLVGAWEAERGWSIAIALGTVYFLGPFHILRRGLDDLAEGVLQGRDALAARTIVAVSNLPFLVLLVLICGPAAGLALLATVGLMVADTTPPIRLRARPFVDVLVAALLVVAPLLCGLLVGGRAPGDLPLVAMAAFLAWAIGSAAIGEHDPAAAAWTPRLIATVALIAYAAAVVLSAALGALGVLAGLAVALFLLLPAMVVAGERSGDGEASLARARGDLPGMIALVGAWIAVLLLQHWGLVAFGPWMAIVAITTFLAGYALVNIVAIRVVTRRHRVPDALGATGAEAPSVTIVVPCHDATVPLPAGLASLREQTYPDSEIVIVVDETATDGTADEAAAWIGEDAVVKAPPRPAGWTSRAWARHVGATSVESDLVLFVDPGVVLAPIAVRVLVEQALARGDDLVLGLVRDLYATTEERATVSGFALLQFAFAPLWWPDITGSRPPALAFGDGALVLVRRAVYLEATATPLDDSLPRVVARGGSKVAVVRMANLAGERRLAGVSEVIDAWRHRVLAYARGWLAGAIALVGLTATAFALPLLLPFIAIATGQDLDIIAASLVPLFALLAVRLALVITQRQSPSTIAWHPVTVVVMLVGQMAGIADHVIGRTERS